MLIGEEQVLVVRSNEVARAAEAGAGPRAGRIARIAVGAAALVGSLGVAATPAGASRPAHNHRHDNGSTWNPDPSGDSQPPSIPSTVSVSQVQAWLATALQLRSEELGSLQASISNAGDLPDSVRSSLNGDVRSAANDIATLTVSAAKDGTLAALRADAAQMIGDRVFAVVEPQAKLVLQSEHQLAMAANIAKLKPGIETAIKTEESSKDARTLKGLDTTLTSDLSSLESSASGVVTDLLSQTPSDYTDASTAITTDTKTVADDGATLGQARGAVGKIVSLLAGHS